MKDKLEAMLAAGRDSALLRFSLGELLYKEGAYAKAAEHLEQAIAQDSQYSAAWKLYGRTLLDAGDIDRAVDVLSHGLEIAEHRGDNQAANEMRVFAKRARKQRDATGSGT